jgi:nucleoside-diphosphate-sugar epimerase
VFRLETYTHIFLLPHQDVDAIAHVASPVIFDAVDPIKEVIELAVSSTLSLLNSAHKYGKNVKHVVVTSSVASIVDGKASPDHVFSEADWNDTAFQAVLETKKNGQPIPPFLAYTASKNEAERAIWRFKAEEKPSFAISTILPSFVYGAILPPPQNEKEVQANTTAKEIVFYYSGENQDPSKDLGLNAFVNVTDVGLAHVRAVERVDKSDGQRYLLNSGPFSFQESVDILRESFPERQNIIAKGQPGKKIDANRFDHSKSVNELGIQYADFKTTVLDTIDSVKHLYK